MGFDRLIKMTKGKLTYRINIIHERHNQSMSMPTDSVEKIGDGKWKVLSENGKTFYEVMEAPTACQEKDACQMSCPMSSLRLLIRLHLPRFTYNEYHMQANPPCEAHNHE